MIIRFRLFAFLLVLILVFPFAPYAQDQAGGTLHVLRPSINAEQDTAELCLEFDHALDPSSASRAISGIHLESDDENVPVTLSNVSIGATSLCLQSLSHRQTYSLTVADLRGAAGEKLTEAYKLSFTIPDRHPALAFVGSADIGHLPRIKKEEPVLRAINVARVKISLYRLTELSQMADAYRQRLLTTLAPSESLLFAKDNAQSVWQGELVLGGEQDEKFLNHSLERPVPLHTAVGALTPGLYLMVAQDTAPAATPKETASLAPIAAQWFIRSDLKIHALRRNDGISVEAESADESSVVKDAHLTLFDADNKKLAETASDAAGIGFLSLTSDQVAAATTVIGLTSAGDIDFADVSADEKVVSENQLTLPNLQTSLIANRPFYKPGAEAYLSLTAHDIHGAAIAIANSSLHLLRPDHSVYMSLPVPDGKAGIYQVSFAVPAVGGLWSLLWQKSDGSALAEAPLRITSNPEMPHITLTTDRTTIGSDGEINFSLKSSTDHGDPAPYMVGQVAVQWVEPDTFAGWSGYHFGTEEKNDGPSTSIAAFITDANGVSKLHLNLKSPDDGALLHTARISVRSDLAMGAFDPDALELPVRPDNTVIGIKPLVPDGKFAENSLARFDVIVIDGDGKRHEDAGLKYQIFQEGRNFAWYQAEGRWDYKPQQQRRRIGGGPIDIKASGANTIRWPVTAGSYALEVTDANGVVLGRLHFYAGWGLLKPDQMQLPDLVLTTDAPFVQPGVPAKIKYRLDHPSVVSAVIADDRIRKVIHEAQPAGENAMTIVPEESWGNRIRIHIDAEQNNNDNVISYSGQIELPMHHHAKELAMTIDAPVRVAGGQELVLPIAVSGDDQQQSTFVSVMATPITENDQPSTSPLDVLTQTIEVGKSGKTLAHLSVPLFFGKLHIICIAANQNQWGQKEFSIPVDGALTADLLLPVTLKTGDAADFLLGLHGNGAPEGVYHYALSTGSGLKLINTLEDNGNFSAKSGKTIPLTLAAQEAGLYTVKLDVTGLHDFRMNRLWPLAVIADDEALTDVTEAHIAPQQTWSPSTEGKPSADKTHTKTRTEPALAFGAAQPLFNAPQILPGLISSTPFTTEEMSEWLETIRLWRDTIIKAEFLSESVLELRQNSIVDQLLKRQRPDGSFPSLPETDGDLNSTAAALVTLAHIDKPLTHIAADAAAGWLRQRLANTWFDEDERAPRAAAFAALAATDRLDISSLRYFAETTDGKNLPPLAMAQLSAALAKSNDQDKAIAWLKAVHESIADTPFLWPAMADNPFFDTHDLLPVLEKESNNLVQHPSHDPARIASFLRAVWIVNNRAGNWRVSINGVEKNQTGILVIPPLAKAATLSLRNPMDRPLYVVSSGKLKAPAFAAWDAAITRHIYQLDGAEIAPGALKRGEIYLMALEGSGPAQNDEQKFFIYDKLGTGLQPFSCMLDGDTGMFGPWGWLKNLSLSAVSSCETDGHEIKAVLTPSSPGAWRAAYLVKAEYAGAFNLAPATRRIFGGDQWVTGSLQPIVIK